MAGTDTLSTQDLEDLDQIRKALPQNDPRVAKIHALVGANAQQPTQFEQERDPKNQPGFWKTAWSDVKNLVPPPEFSASDIPVLGSAIGAARNIENAKEDYGKRKQEGRSPAYNALSTAVEGSGLIPGLNPRAMEEASNVGNKSAIMGHAAVPAAIAAAPLAAEGIGKLAPQVRDTVGGWRHTPEGDLTPGAKLINSFRPLGVPVGGAVGYAADKLFPEPAAAVAARESAEAAAAEPTFQKLSEGPTANEHAAARSLARQQARKTLIGGPEATEPTARVPNLKIGTPDVNVIPEPRGEFEGEVPNYMASVPRKELNDLALAAKPGAGKQLQQLGKPIIYIPKGYQ